MSPMSDQPLTLGVLAQFHREVILPDVERIVGEAIGASERRMQANFDAIFHKLEKLETEYEFLKVGFARVEERLGRVEGRLDRMEQRLDQMDGRLDRMDGRLDVLERQYRDLLAGLHRLEERLSRVERQVDALAAAKEKEPLRAEVADLRERVDSLQAQVRTLEERLGR